MKTLSLRWLLALSSVALAPAACSSDPSPPGGIADAGADVEPDAGLPCASSGISKGPWVQAIKGDSASIRWEACRSGTEGGLTITPEVGGPGKEATSVETPFEVTETFEAPFNPAATPDFAGTYYMHEASLSGLAAGSCYRYELAADPQRKGRFCAARPSGDPLRFMALGDTNPALGGHAEKVVAAMLPKNPDFVLHGGDIQYYSSTLETWAYWFSAMQPMLSQGGFFAAVGNHEDELPGEFDQYYKRFFAGAGSEGVPEYYLFDSAGVRFFSLDTEQSLDLGSPQGTWLSSKLEEASKAAGYRFSVIFLHKPLVTCGDTGDNPSAVAQLEPLFLQYKVPLVLQAHMHGYERFDINGVTYITTAGGGGSIGNVDENTERSYCSMRVASGPFFHGVLFDVAAGKLSGVAIDEDGVEKDSFMYAVP